MAAAEAAEAVNEVLSEAWKGADQAFEADAGLAFDDRRAATPEGIRDATSEADTNALLVETALEQLASDPEAGLETAAGLGDEGAALLRLAAAHTAPALRPCLPARRPGHPRR